MWNTLSEQYEKKKVEKMAYTGIARLYDKWCSGDSFYKQTEHFYMQMLSQRKGPFLELGIGTGRLARLLIQNHAVDVTGIDICDEMLAICDAEYQRQKRAGCSGNLYMKKEDMTKLHYCEQFETVYLPFRTVGHLLDKEQLMAMFQGVYRALKPAGIFLLDHYMFDRTWAEEHNNRDLPMYCDDTVKIEDHYVYDFEKEYMDCKIKVNGMVEDQFLFRWYSKEYIGKAAEEAGFVLEKLMGEFDGSAWSEQSGNQIWMWRK